RQARRGHDPDPRRRARPARTPRGTPAMSTAMDDERIDLLILARLASPAKRPPAARKVCDELGRLADAQAGAAWRERFAERLAALRERGDIGPGPRLAVTDAGRARLAAGLGVDPVPAWRTLRRWVLPALGLELASRGARVRERLGTAGGLRGTVLSRAYPLRGPGA